MQTTQKPKLQRRQVFSVTEQASSCKGRVDHANGIIRGVKILGRISVNGREYTDAALESAVPHYERVRVNFDHPTKANIKQPRSVKDWVGQLENVRKSGDGVYGDLVLIKSHPYAPAILEAAERFPAKFGLSHNADCGGYTGNRGQVVEFVDKVRSVDLVQNPATNVSLFEGVETVDDMADFDGDGSVNSSPLENALQKIAKQLADSRLSDAQKLAAIAKTVETARIRVPAKIKEPGAPSVNSETPTMEGVDLNGRPNYGGRSGMARIIGKPKTRGGVQLHIKSELREAARPLCVTESDQSTPTRYADRNEFVALANGRTPQSRSVTESEDEPKRKNSLAAAFGSKKRRS